MTRYGNKIDCHVINNICSKDLFHTKKERKSYLLIISSKLHLYLFCKRLNYFYLYYNMQLCNNNTSFLITISIKLFQIMYVLNIF